MMTQEQIDRLLGNVRPDALRTGGFTASNLTSLVDEAADRVAPSPPSQPTSPAASSTDPSDRLAAQSRTPLGLDAAELDRMVRERASQAQGRPPPPAGLMLAEEKQRQLAAEQPAPKVEPQGEPVSAARFAAPPPDPTRRPAGFKDAPAAPAVSSWMRDPGTQSREAHEATALAVAQREARRRRLIATLTGAAATALTGGRAQGLISAQHAAAMADADRPVAEHAQRLQLGEAQRRRTAEEYAQAQTRAAAEREQRQRQEIEDPNSARNRVFRETWNQLNPDLRLPDTASLANSETLQLYAQTAQGRQAAAARAAQEAAERAEHDRRFAMANTEHDRRFDREAQEHLRRARAAGGLGDPGAENRAAGAGVTGDATALRAAVRARLEGANVDDATIDSVVAQIGDSGRLDVRVENQVNRLISERAGQSESESRVSVQERREIRDRAGRAQTATRSAEMAVGRIGDLRNAVQAATDVELRYALQEELPPEGVRVLGGDPDRVASLRRGLLNLRGLELKDRSGAAVSNAEFARITNEIGAGRLATRGELLGGLGQLETASRRHIDDTLADEPPEVVHYIQSGEYVPFGSIRRGDSAGGGRSAPTRQDAPAQTGVPAATGGAMVTLRDPASGQTRTVRRGGPVHRAALEAGAEEVE